LRQNLSALRRYTTKTLPRLGGSVHCSKQFELATVGQIGLPVLGFRSVIKPGHHEIHNFSIACKRIVWDEP
jgi:hypothetical protein